MNAPTLPGLFVPELRVQHAIARAVDHAEQLREGWAHEAAELVLAFAIGQFQPWLFEEARAYAESHGLAAPPDSRAWGGVARMLRQRKAIVGVGTRKDAYGSLKSTWRMV